MKHPVLVTCVVVCLLSVALFFLFGRPPAEQDRVAVKFFSALKENASKAIPICVNETPFKSEQKTYYAHVCLLETACQIKATSNKEAIDACRKLDLVQLIPGDQNITSDTCIKYIDANC
ncbi:MAG: hypothetical protein V1909_04330 [Candidatus Micrarchaeota archaeon]